MATTELSNSSSGSQPNELSPGQQKRLASALRQTWPRAYLATWLLTLGSALLVALLGAGLKRGTRALLGLRLQASGNAPPAIGHILALAAHNLPIAAWPILLGVVGAHRHRLARSSADIVVFETLLANTAQVGAAIGAYGARLLAYVPQLPVEWAALALGVSAWLVQRHRALLLGEAVVLVALIASVVLTAAALETIAVPHRAASGGERASNLSFVPHSGRPSYQVAAPATAIASKLYVRNRSVLSLLQG